MNIYYITMYKHLRVSDVIKYYLKKLNDVDNLAILCRVGNILIMLIV